MYMNLFLLLCLTIQIYFTVRSVINYNKSRKASTKFVDEIMAQNEAWKNEYIERQTLLAKENAKLMEKCEMYRDKLKNLGFSDVTLDN